MEELELSYEELEGWEEELIERRKAAGDPDPWDGKLPNTTLADF